MRLEYASKNKAIIQEPIDSEGRHIDSGEFVIVLNDNVPTFTDDDIKQLEEKGYHFSDLIERRCGEAFACINRNTLSSGHDNIQSKPTGFPDSVEENTVNNRLIFQRCHLIGYHLLKKMNDEDNEDKNLKRIFTGTRFMNNEMLYYEKKIAQYVKEDKRRQVYYRVTPEFKGKDKVVYGVKMEAKFINENGIEDKDLSFNILIYNKQPDIYFKYETGEILKDKSMNLSEEMSKTDRNYIINKRSKRFHLKCCASVWYMDKEKKQEFFGKREELINGINIKFKCYPCAICASGTK